MDDRKERFYKAATRKLLNQLDTMKLSATERHNAKKLTLMFRIMFKNPQVKMATFGPELNYDISMFTYHADGFCKASSQSFMHLMQSPDWKLMYINETWTFGPHHYLLHVPSRQVFDLTADQYAQYGIDIPYNMGYRVTLNKQERQSAERFLKAVRSFTQTEKDLDNAKTRTICKAGHDI